VHIERDGAIGVIIIDNPPVNAITPQVRLGIDAAIGELRDDTALHAVVLHCAGSNFMAGADIRLLGIGPKPVRTSNDIISALESLEVPVIAALQGHVLGGGLEFALGCHYRCATAATRLGVPEVNLGLIPGAGGTQRLPRLIGIEKALQLIVGGAPISAEEAVKIGLVDRLVGSGSLLDSAIAYARELVAAGAMPRRTRERSVTAPRESEFEAAAALAARDRPGAIAPLKGIEALRAAVALPFGEGIAVEARLFAECLDSAQSRALRHLFIAEREAGKLRGMPSAEPSRRIERIGVIGGGTMGRGITMAIANAGLAVTLIETDADALARAQKNIADSYAASVAKGRLAAAERDARLAAIAGSLDMGSLADADLVIEAVFEDLPLKQQIFRDLDRICKPGAMLATNTSAIDIDRIASATRRPEDVVGLHFFSPAQVMKLLEVVRGAATRVEILKTSLSLAKTLKKFAVVAGNCDGFIGNRMLIGYRREAEFLLLEGASPAQIDQAMLEFGMAMGPLTMGDMAGLDISASGRRRRRAEGKLPPDERFGAVPDRLVEANRLGQKTGAGYYRYEPGSYKALPDPTVAALIEREAERLGVQRRVIANDEIVARCIYPLINEAARILAEGMAQRPSDIDVVWVNGYGFPRLRGGPMQYADEIGLPAVVQKLREFERLHGTMYWTPAPLLDELVAGGKDFNHLNSGEHL
jgi:3-hydroxyacyl-CoA dehydrogenase